MNQAMVAFHGKAEVKAKYLNRVREHRAKDELLQGATGQNGKGCAVWCTLNDYSHAGYEGELGIPRMLARLEDGIFEGMRKERAMSWPEEFLSAITPGADLGQVSNRFLHWLLVDEAEGLIRFASTDEHRASIRMVGDLYERLIRGEVVEHAERWKIREETWRVRRLSYAAAAADAAAAAADADADADAAAAAAADAAAAAAAADAADAAAWRMRWNGEYYKRRARQGEKLIELLAAAPVKEEVVA